MHPVQAGRASRGPDSPLEHRLRRLFLALIALKVALGLSLLLAYLGSPLGAGLSLDEESYFAWAQRIVGGDLLGRGPFFQDPLYPYVLAGILRLCSGAVIAARLFNLGLGVLSLVLLERVVRRLFSPAQALAAAALWVLLGSVVLDELTVSKEPLMVALLLGAAALALEVEGRRPALAFGAGIAGGALVLARGNFLVLLPFAALLAVRLWPRRVAACAVGGLLLFPSIFAVRNGLQEGRWLPSTASTGMVFFIGHNPEADGTWVQAPFAKGNPTEEMPDYVREASRRRGTEATASEASRLFLGEGLQFMAGHPLEELGLIWRKIRLTLSWEEVPGNYSRSCVRDRFIPGLWLAPLTGAVLWPLALAGLVAHRRRRVIQIIAAASLLYAATLWATFIVERYRLPLWVAVVALAPSGALALRDWLRSPQRNRVLVTSVPVLCLLAWPIRVGSGDRELGHCLALAGATLLQAGRFEEARPLLVEAVQINPKDSIAAFNLGLFYRSESRWSEAAASFRTAVDANAENAPAWWALGVALQESGDRQPAQTAFDVFFSRAPQDLIVHACAEVTASPSLSWLWPRCSAAATKVERTTDF